MSTRRPSSRREAGNSPAPGRGARLQRRCACGNHAAGGGTCAACARRQAARGEPLTVGAAHDALEQDADRAAALATAPAASRVGGVARPPASGAVAAAGDAGPAPAIVHDTLADAGQPLETGLRHDMEHRLGHDFSGVRVHTDAMAARSAASVDALAYTVGRDVVFGAGQYAPHSATGRELAAHELAHVAQQDGGASAGVVRRQVPRPAPVDADAQRIIDLAADTTTTTEQKGPAIVQAIIDQYFAGDASKITRITFNRSVSGLLTTYHGTGAATTGTIEVGEDFVTGTTQRHFARRVIQVGHEIEHVDQVRSGMAGEARSDEREFIAHYHGAIRTELPGTGRVQHSTRVQMIDGALGYYHCLSADLRRDNTTRRDELITRRAAEVRRSGRNDLGAAPTTCTRAPGDSGPRAAAGGGGLSGGAIAGIVLGGIAGAAAIGLGIAALAGAFS